MSKKDVKFSEFWQDATEIALDEEKAAALDDMYDAWYADDSARMLKSLNHFVMIGRGVAKQVATEKSVTFLVMFDEMRKAYEAYLEKEE